MKNLHLALVVLAFTLFDVVLSTGLLAYYEYSGQGLNPWLCLILAGVAVFGSCVVAVLCWRASE